MLTFLINNSYKVYHLFGNAWNNVSHLVDVLFSSISIFFGLTYPYFIAPLINILPQLRQLATIYYFNIINLASSLYYNLTVLGLTYYSRLSYLSGVMYSSLNVLVFSMYSKLLILTGTVYTNIVNFSNIYYSKIVGVFGFYYANLLKYLTSWFSIAGLIFGVLYTKIIYLTNQANILAIAALVSSLSKIIAFINLPLFNLKSLAIDLYNGISQLVFTLLPHAILFATSGVKLIKSLIVILPAILSVMSTNYRAIVDSLVADYTQGFPLLTKAIRDNIEVWLLDNILGLIDKAVDRFW